MVLLNTTNCSFNVNSDFILCFCDFILFKLLTLICEKGGIAYLAGTFSSKSAMTNPLSIITESFGSKTDYTRSSCDVFIRDNNLFCYFIPFVRGSGTFWKTTVTVIRGFCSFPFCRCLHNIHTVSHIAGIRADIYVVILSVGRSRFVWIRADMHVFIELFLNPFCSPFWFEFMRTWPRFHVAMAAAWKRPIIHYWAGLQDDASVLVTVWKCLFRQLVRGFYMLCHWAWECLGSTAATSITSKTCRWQRWRDLLHDTCSFTYT